MPTFSYSLSDFLPFTKIRASDFNTKFNDIATFLNGQIGNSNIADNSINRNTKLLATTANTVAINDADGKLSEEAQLSLTRGGLGFAPSLSGKAGNVIGVKADESGLELQIGQAGNLSMNLASDIASLTAGEGISANDAVCLALDADNNYRVFKADSDALNRKTTFIGFALAAATVTANIKTYTASDAFVASNVILTTINSRTYSTTYSSSSDETLQAVANQIATDPDIQSAVVTVVGGNQTGTDDRVITVTGKGGIPINISATVSGGVSQPTIDVAQTQAASGQSVRIRTYGVLDGFSSLTTSNLYYLSTTAGAITDVPSDSSPQIVGQALSSTALFINAFKYGLTFGFRTLNLFVRSHGALTSLAAASATASVQHYNFTSWSAGTDDSNSRWNMHTAAALFNGSHWAVDGCNTSDAVTAMTRIYTGSSWSSASGGNRGTPKAAQGVGALNTAIYFGKGSTDNGVTGATGVVDSNNGTSWTSTVTTFAGAYATPNSFTQGGKVRWIGGSNSGGTGQTAHDAWNGTSQSSESARPASTTASGASGACPTSAGVIGAYNTTNTYKWDGSSWSSAISLTYNTNATNNVKNCGPACSQNLATSNLFINGGVDGGSNCLTTSALFNGSSWSASTAASSAKAGAQGGTV